jgi:hypothetical protein
MSIRIGGGYCSLSWRLRKFPGKMGYKNKDVGIQLKHSNESKPPKTHISKLFL